MKKNVKNLKKELNQRRNKKELVYDVVGVELKDRRLSLCRTLSSIASKICSSSYLCKIERNQITPNRYYLKEICNRLDMSDEKVKVLLNLKTTLSDVVKAFLVKDAAMIRNARQGGIGLTNYRYRIIELIYYIFEKDYFSANKIFSDLIKLIGNMTDYDLVIFALFSGVLSFYNQEFNIALKTLKAINDFNCSDYIRIIKGLYLFYSYKCLNSPICIFEYDKIRKILLRNAYYDLVDEINYVLALYLIKNKYYQTYGDIYHLIKNDEYKYSLLYLSRRIISPKTDCSKIIDKTNDFCRYLEMIRIEPEKAKEMIGRLNSIMFDVDFNLLILQYQILETDDEKMDFINNIALPTLEKTNDQYLIDYFLEEINILSVTKSKYKNFSYAYKVLKQRIYG